MITYCTGLEAIKKSHFKKEQTQNILSLDNDEVLASFVCGKKLYTIIGDIPFGDMSICEYVNYQRALSQCGNLNSDEIKQLIKKRVGLCFRLSKKMREVSRVEYRAISLASRMLDTTDTIYVSFDALEFTHKNHYTIQKIAKTLGKKINVFVSVSDTRFVPRSSVLLHYSENGIDSKRHRVSLKTINKSITRRRLCYGGMCNELCDVKSIVRQKI